MRYPPLVVSALVLMLATGCASLPFAACDDAELEAFVEIEHYVSNEPSPMNEGGCNGGFQTTGSVVDVLDHYEMQLREAGWTIASRRIRTGADIDPMEPGGTVSPDAVEGDLTASRGDLRAFVTYAKGNVPLQPDDQADLAAVGITIARSPGLSSRAWDGTVRSGERRFGISPTYDGTGNPDRPPASTADSSRRAEGTVRRCPSAVAQCPSSYLLSLSTNTRP